MIEPRERLEIHRNGELLWVDRQGLCYEFSEYEPLRRTHRLRVLRDGVLVHLDRLELGQARARAITLRAFDADQRAAIDRLLQLVADQHHAELARMEAELAPVLVTLDSVAREPVEWLWPGRVPRRKLIILEGDPGLGKSMLALDLAARLSVGADLPDGECNPFDGQPVSTVLLSAEDDPGDTIRPRLEEAGGNPALVTLFRGVETPGGERVPNLADVEGLRRAVQQTDARYVIVDPLSAYVPPAANAWKDDEMRRLLLPIVQLAAEFDFGPMVIRHLTKNNRSPAIYRGQASIGIGGAVRGVFVVGKHPGDATGNQRVMATVKANFGPEPPPLGYRIVSDFAAPPHVRWDRPGALTFTADELLSAAQERDESEERNDRAVEEAEAVLRDILRDGPLQSEGTDGVYAKARRAGVARRTLERAKRNIGVRARPDPVGGKWRWYPPVDELRQGSYVDEQGEVGEVGALTTNGRADELPW